MGTRALIFLLIVTLCPAAGALAKEEIVEVVKPVGLFSLTDFYQSVSLSYEYSGHDTDVSGGNSSTNHFMEKYHLSIGSYILDPHFISLRIDGDVWFDQYSVSSDGLGAQSSNQMLYQYNLAGSVLDRSKFPMYIMSMRQLNTVVSPYTPSYTYDTTRNGVRGNVSNNYLPIWYSYYRNTYDTTGLGNDTSNVSDSFDVQMRHDLGTRSHTEIDGTANLQSQDAPAQTKIKMGQMTSKTTSFGITFSNSLQLDRSSNYVLGSSFSSQQSKNGAIPQQTIDWTEALECHFGKALRGTLTYRYTSNKTLSYNLQDQITTSNDFIATLSHQLFSSLFTTVSGYYRFGELLGGNQTTYGGTASLNYQKKLPKMSDLSLMVKVDHQATDQQFSGNQQTVRDEQWAAPLQGQFIYLNVKGVSISVIYVQSQNPLITYVPGVDYRVNSRLGQIEIIAGGGIAPGTNLFITYVVTLNTLNNFNTDTFIATGALNLFASRYRITGNYLTQNFTPISGSQNQQVGYNNSRSASVSASANFSPNLFFAEYGNSVTGPAKSSYGEGGWSFNYRFLQSSLTLKARDRYTLREDSFMSLTTSENNIEVGASYNRTLFSWLNLTSSADYIHSTGDVIIKDYLYIRGTLQGRINKLLISLVGQSLLRVRSDATVRDDYLRVEVTRFF